MPENPKSPHDQFLDELLDASLREYGRGQPRAGLESRVLRRLAEAPKSSWMTAWRWSALGAVATVVVVALALITYPPESRVGPLPAAPPPNRTPRYNQTVQQSGVQPNFGGAQTKSKELRPCKPGERPNSAARKSTQDTQQSTKNETKVSEDCIPASAKQPQPPR